MKKNWRITINSEIERMIIDFCFRKNMDIREFVEDAIMEKIENEEMKENVSEIISSDEYRGGILKEYILEELDIPKKKH